LHRTDNARGRRGPCRVGDKWRVRNGDFTGWTVTGDGISIDSVFPATGNFDAAFGASSDDPDPGILSQSIVTTPGTSYSLSFSLQDESGNPGNSFVISFGGYSATITGDAAAFSYTDESFLVPVGDITDISTTLSFQGINNDSDWNLDDVSVTQTSIPEPPMGLMLTAAALLVFSLAKVRARRA
jgi:hypothetical protein